MNLRFVIGTLIVAWVAWWLLPWWMFVAFLVTAVVIAVVVKLHRRNPFLRYHIGRSKAPVR